MSASYTAKCSAGARLYQDKFTLWVKTKDRFDGLGIIGPDILDEMAKWLWKNNIDFECNRSGHWPNAQGYRQMRFADQYFLAIFPANESEMNAVKIVWGENLSAGPFA